MVEIAWQEFNKRGEIKTKTKRFESEHKAAMYLEKLYEKDNFYRYLGTRKEN